MVTPKDCPSIPPNADDNALRVLRDVSNQRGIDGRVRLSVFETAWVESHINNLPCGDADSVGVFQQKPQYWCPGQPNLCMDVPHATNKYLDTAIPIAANNPGMTAGQVAQATQRSGHPERYDQSQAIAQNLISRANGLPGGGLQPAGPGSAQVLITGMDGNLYHEVRYPDGNWTGFAGLSRVAKSVGVAGMKDGSAQVVIVGNDDKVYHEIRYRDGTWSGFAGLPGIGTTAPAGAKAVSIAGMKDGSAQVLIIGLDDRVYHEVRYADGNWSGIGQIPGIGAANFMTAKAIGIAGLPDGSSQVLVVGLDDKVYHQVRHADGNWTGFNGVPGIGTTAPAGAKKVAIAGMSDGSAQVLIIGLDNGVYHQIRYADGNWTGFAGLPGIGTTDAAGAKEISIGADPDNSAQVAIVGLDDRVYHEIRYANANWSGFNGLPGIGTTAPAGATKVTVTGMP